MNRVLGFWVWDARVTVRLDDMIGGYMEACAVLLVVSVRELMQSLSSVESSFEKSHQCSLKEP